MALNRSSLKLSATALAAVAALTLGGIAHSQTVSDTAENGRLWFVELIGSPVADGVKLATVQAEKAAFRSRVAAAGISYTERRSYDTLFNGFAVEISPLERAKLAKLSGVRALYPVDMVQAPTPQQVEATVPDMVAAINLTGAKVAQDSLGLTGAGVKVGVIDTGIDIDHPAFGGNGTNGSTSFPTARVVSGYDFVGDAYNSSGTTTAELTPVPDAVPDDCGGHGTHVAGIIGGNGGGILGVAPKVSLGAYRVFGCTGTSSADVIIAAMERALADGMQVINQSLGAARQWPQYPTAQAAARLAKKGVVMVAAAGNNGPGGSSPDALFAGGAPGVADGVISVASFDNAQRAFTVGSTPFGFNAVTGAGTAPTSGSASLARTGTTSTANDACTALPAGSLSGKVALIRRGTCNFYTKAYNAQTAGAIGVVLYNNTTGALAATVAGSTPAITIPVVGVAQTQGVALDALIAAGGAELNWGTSYAGYPYGTGGLISSFSSFGLAPDLSFKPQLGAPGGSIISSYPIELGSTTTLSGTSMATPHVAGAAALVLQAIPTAALGRTSAVVGNSSLPQINMLTRLMNTAKPKSWSDIPDAGYTDFSFRQGAGMLDVVSAVQSKQFVLPAQIATGESEGGATTQKLTLRNDASTAITYTVGHQPALAAAANAANAASTAWVLGGVHSAPATVGFSSTTVTVPAKGTASVNVTISANTALADRALYGGYITFTPASSGTALVVPYGGLKGDYQSIQVLRPTTNGYPWLTNYTGSSFRRCSSDCSYSLADLNNMPIVILQLAHQSRTLRLEAFDVATGESRGVISEDNYVGRNSSPATSAFNYYIWDGTTSQGTVANGSYQIRVSVLKALGDASNAAHWETWTSPNVTIARP